MKTVADNGLMVQGFMHMVKAAAIPKGCLGIYWLGQAGFLLKTADGTLIAIDAYLSDSCERLAGFKRIMRSVVPSEEFKADYYFVSHNHADHFDIDLIDALKTCVGFQLAGSAGCALQAQALGLDPSRLMTLQENKRVDFGEFTLLPVKADHGELAPDALGFIFDFGFTKVYFAGDTAYSPDQLQVVYNAKPDVALLPINGEYGNLNASQAVWLAKDIGCKVVIPCHYWMFIEHGANPLEFKKAMEAEAPHIQTVFLAQGEGYICRNVP